MLKPPKGCAPTMAPVHLRLMYKLPTWNSLDGAVNLVARLGVDGAGQAELGVVGDFERVVEAAGFDHGQHRAEDLFLL